MTARQRALVVAQWIGAHWRARFLHGARLRAWQDRRARRLVRDVVRDAPFFRTHWAGHDLRRWDALPTVDKQTMMANFDTYTTRGVRSERAMEVALAAETTRDFQPVLEGLTVGLSSGTSGHRGLFVLSAPEQAAWAGTIVARVLHGRPRRVRVAFFLRSNSNLYEQTGSSLIRFRYFDLMTPLDEAIRALEVFQPTLVVAPPAMLLLLAHARTAGRLRIAPRRCVSVADVLEPHEETEIAAAFDVPVHQVYQATEGLLAVSCANGSLHVQEDIVRLQYEPLEGDSAPEEQRWTPIVTDLWRRTQPIARYRLNDVLQLDNQPCLCGSDWQVIRRVEGRRDDVLHFERHDGGERLFFPDTLRRAVLLTAPDIVDYQVVQDGGGVHIHLCLAPDSNQGATIDAVRTSIVRTIERYGCRAPALHIDTDFEPPPPNRKRRRVIRRIP